MKMKQLSIEELWGKYTFSVDFDEQVTILIGKNGSGKTTILNLLDVLLSQGKNNNFYQFKKLELLFDNNVATLVEQKSSNIKNEIEKLDLINENTLKELLNKIQKDIIKKIEEKSSNKFLPKIISLEEKDSSTHNINYLFLSTFDMEVKNKELIQKYHDIPYNIKTELDILLNKLITEFKLYQLKLKVKVEKVQKEFDSKLEEYATDKDSNKLKNKLLEKNKIISDIYHNRDLLKNKINSFFMDTGKSINLDENNSIIFHINDKEHLNPYQLSSGEKQILIIMLNVMLLENKPTILLMDEPEISLHVEWQRIFIKTILELNSNLQLIIATHSPAIVSKGYRDNVINLNNFTIKN